MISNIKINPWPAGIITFFLVLTVINILNYSLAIEDPYELVTAQYYQEGLAYEEVIQAVKTSKNSDLILSTSLQEIPLGKRLHFSLKSPKGLAMQGLKGNLHLYRPSNANWDEHKELTEITAGEYVVDFAKLNVGKWKIQLTFLDQSDKLVFYHDNSLIVSNTP